MISRTEVIGLIIKLALLTGVTFFSVKWMITQLDPTHKQKKSAKKKVGYLLFKSLGYYGVIFYLFVHNLTRLKCPRFCACYSLYASPAILVTSLNIFCNKFIIMRHERWFI